jgi:hypothetical protein
MAVDTSTIPPERLHRFYKVVNEDARQRLAQAGIIVPPAEMAAWTAMYVHLKEREAGKNSFFNAMSALAISEAAFEDDILTVTEEEADHG